MQQDIVNCPCHEQELSNDPLNELGLFPDQWFAGIISDTLNLGSAIDALRIGWSLEVLLWFGHF